MCSKGYKLLFLLLTPLICKYKLKATDEDYAYTHAFTKDENRKNFFEIYGKIKEHVLQGIVKGNDKSTNKIKEDIETFNTITRNILEQSDYYNDISERDMLFNNEFLKKCLFGLNSNGEGLIDSLFEENNIETASERIMASLNLITKNNWHRKTDNLKNIIAYSQEDEKNLKKIESIYKLFKEDEYQFIKLFSENSAKYRYGIDDYNFLIDFTDNNLATKTQIITRRFLLAVIFTIVIAIFIYKYISYKEEPDKNTFFSGVEDIPENISYNMKTISKSLYAYKSFKLLTLMRELFLLVSRCIPAICDYISNKISNQLWLADIKNIITKYSIPAFAKATFVVPIIIYIISISKLLLWPKNFNTSLFRKFYVISRYIKNAHHLYNICKENKQLQIFLYNDLSSIRSLFETDDEKLKELLDFATHSSQNLYSINVFNLINVADFVCRFDKSRKSFLNSIIEFILFKNYINTLKTAKSNMSQKWSIPTFDEEERGLKFKNLYNISLKNGGVPINLLFSKRNKGMFFFETSSNDEKGVQQALMLALLFINGYGICPCEETEICCLDYIHYTPDIFTSTKENDSNLKKWIDVAIKYFNAKSKIIDLYKRKQKKYLPLFLNIMNEAHERALRPAMFVNLLLNIIKDKNTFLYLIHHNDEVSEIKNKFPQLKYYNKYIEYLNDENRNTLQNGENNDDLDIELTLDEMYPNNESSKRTYLTVNPTI